MYEKCIFYITKNPFSRLLIPNVFLNFMHVYRFFTLKATQLKKNQISQKKKKIILLF